MEERNCPKCGKYKPLSEFYTRPDRNGKIQSYCKLCNHANTLARQRKLKAIAVEYLGGKCANCGIVGHPAIYDFHHSNPSTKTFTIGHAKLTKFESIKSELDKCVLLCSNCHRTHHAGY